MRVLNLEEKNQLIGKAVDLKLPAGSSLYLKTGVPQLFLKVNSQGAESFPDWLYIPTNTLNDIRRQMIVSCCSTEQTMVSLELYEIDNIYSYPVIKDGTIVGHIVVDSKIENLIDGKINSKIFEFLKTYNFSNFDSYDGLDEISDLAKEEELDFNNFFKKYLNLLIKDNEKACAGLYYLDNNNYKLRMIVGDLSRYDNFIGMISDDFSYVIKTELENNNNFIKLDSTQEESMLSNEPIEIYYIHRVIKSQVGEYIVLMPLSGAVSEDYINRLQQLSKLVSLVKFNRFNSDSFLMDNYKSIFNKNNEMIPFQKFIKSIFNKIRGFLPIKAISFVGDNLGTYTVLQSDDDVINITEKTLFLSAFDIDITESIPLDIKSTSPFGPILNHIPMKFGEAKYSRILKINTENENNYALSFTFDDEFKDKKFIDKVMDQTQEIILHYLNVKHIHKRMDISVVQSLFSNQNTQIVRRWSTISKLTSGYFHSLYSFISVIMGQSEIIEASLRDQKLSNEEQLFRSVNKIQSASDQLSHSLELFKRICPDDNILPDEKMSCKNLIKTYPEIFGEYLNSIEANKKLKLSFSISTSNSIDYDLSYENVFDVIIPLTVLILDYAVSNSRIEITMSNSGGFDNLNYQFHSNMLGTVSIVQILNKVFPDHNLVDIDKNRGRVEIGDLIVFYEQGLNHLEKIIIKKKSIFFKEL